MADLAAANLSVRLGGADIVRNASFRVGGGEVVALIGPNGAGKTSLIRAALGLVRPTSGGAMLDGENVATLPPAARARRVAYLPQVRPLAWPGRVRDIVALGRFAHGAAPERLSQADADAVARALDACALTALANRAADTLSGGERARMHIARALAAGAPLIVADEPTAALDPLHQFAVMTLLRRFREEGGGALVVLHDIGLAARFADRLLWMREGRIVADGSPNRTLTPDRMAEIYGVRARIDGADVRIEGPA